MARFFRPNFLDHFNLSNTQLGDMFSFYGVIAFLSYFPGGLLADKFSPRKLISTSLILTGLGGIIINYLSNGPNILYYVFAYWGFTTIFLFWSALIKATRDWGGDLSQGKAFGILDGGRGLAASVFASIAIFYFGQELSENFKHVILFYTIATLVVGVLAWIILEDSSSSDGQDSEFDFKQVLYVLKNINIWKISIIVICAYCGYKSLDNYGLYATEILGMSDVASTKFVTSISYSRSVVAILAGFFADKWNTKNVILVCSLTLLLSYFLLGFVSASLMTLIYINIICSVFAVYALRAVYFALMEEVNVKRNATGTAVGVISLMGYTPDIFFSSITGRVLDYGENSFQYYFLLMSGISLLGLISIYTLETRKRLN